MDGILPPYRIFQSGDNAVTIDYGNRIDPAVNQVVLSQYYRFISVPVVGVREMVPAFSSLTFYYDVIQVRNKYSVKTTAAQVIREEIEKRLQQPTPYRDIPQRMMRIPVCYESSYAVDMPVLTAHAGLTEDAVIQIHTAITYQVYMLGFLPGFAYMGEVDSRIVVPRKSQPVTVSAGSIGIAGKQTGIYSFDSPGGWVIIGRTPLRLFDPANAIPALLQAGDSVRFYSITRDEFDNY
jgi:inhibitor of KinA